MCKVYSFPALQARKVVNECLHEQMKERATYEEVAFILLRLNDTGEKVSLDDFIACIEYMRKANTLH